MRSPKGQRAPQTVPGFRQSFQRQGRRIREAGGKAGMIERMERLAPLGYHTIPVNDPSNVVELLVRHNCRVVLLDVQMPQANGLEVLTQIKQYDGGVLTNWGGWLRLLEEKFGPDKSAVRTAWNRVSNQLQRDWLPNSSCTVMLSEASAAMNRSDGGRSSSREANDGRRIARPASTSAASRSRIKASTRRPLASGTRK